MNTVILINIIVILVGVIGYVIWNLMKKVEKLESMIDVQEKYITDFYELVKQSESKIKEIDSKQLFQSDDEVGFFFNNLKNNTRGSYQIILNL
jgi:uncharacterized membrane protein YukC